MATAIQTQITRLENVKADIASAIASKGVTVPSGAKLDDYADLIRSISSMSNIILPNAGSHNSIYRGKNLGSSVTTAQWNAIKAGTFNDLYIGDYWVINSINWRIAAFDYYYNAAYGLSTHHVVIVPDTYLIKSAMCDSEADVVNGFIGTKIYKTALATAKTKASSAFGASHILAHNQYLSKAANADGIVTALDFYNVTTCLMSEINVYGCLINSAAISPTTGDNTSFDKSQYPLFSHAPHLIPSGTSYWLRNTAKSNSFAFVPASGTANKAKVTSSFGVRPYFLIS